MEVAASYNNLGVVYYKMGDMGKAMWNFERSLEIKIEIYGDNSKHPVIIGTQENIGKIFILILNK